MVLLTSVSAMLWKRRKKMKNWSSRKEARWVPDCLLVFAVLYDAPEVALRSYLDQEIH